MGWALADVAPGSVFEKLGVRRGDVIKAVNGEFVDSIAKAQQMYQSFKSGTDNISIQIDRDGRPETLSFNIVK